MSQPTQRIQRVSIHGGHSGQFCNHARDSLAEIVEAYRSKGFTWVGLTEHMPPIREDYLFPEEKAAGHTVASLARRFDAYVTEARRLQKAYAGQMEIFVGFETESYPGAVEQALSLQERYRPDYVLGSVHYIDEIDFDGNADSYGQALRAAGGIEALYCRYFDVQHDLIQRIRPRVVGHFDLIRIFDPNYPRRLSLPAVQERIRRNLALIARLDLILDFNAAALRKGASEPYVSKPILEQALQMGISLVPSDDSHGVETVGARLDEAIALLVELGADTHWRRPFP